MLTDQQKLEYDELGYTRVRHAFSPEDAAEMVDRIWTAMQRNFGVRRDAGSLLGLPSGTSEITISSAELWGVGIVQDIDRAAMKLYAALRVWEFEIEAATASAAPDAVPLEDMVSVAVGGRIDF